MNRANRTSCVAKDEGDEAHLSWTRLRRESMAQAATNRALELD